MARSRYLEANKYFHREIDWKYFQWLSLLLLKSNCVVVD